VRADATAAVESVHRGKLVGVEREVENVQVLRDATGADGLGNHDAALLQAPSPYDLGGGLAVRCGDCEDRGVASTAPCASGLHASVATPCRVSASITRLVCSAGAARSG